MRLTKNKLYRVVLKSGFFIVLAISTITFNSCNESPEIFGSDFLPSEDFSRVFKVTDYNIEAHTVTQDSIPVGIPKTALLGYYHDPIFGATKTGFISEFHPSMSSYTFGDNPVLDSLVLTIQRYDYVGEEDRELKLRIYHITDTMDLDKVYYSTYDALDILGDLIIETDLKFKYNTANIIMPEELGNFFLAMEDSVLTNSNYYRGLFPGLYFEVVDEGGEGQINFIDFEDNPNTFLKVYYTNDNETEEETESSQLSYTFTTSNTVMRINMIENNYDLANLLAVNDTVNQDSVMYVQGLGGVVGMIKLNSIYEWIDSSNVVVNKAELVMPVADEYTNEAIYPENLILFYRGASDTTYYQVPDNSVGDVFFGGGYHTGNKEYRFRITRYFNDIIQEEHSYENLYIFNKSNVYSPKRVVLNSGNNSNPIRLEITYTKYK